MNFYYIFLIHHYYKFYNNVELNMRRIKKSKSSILQKEISNN